MILYKSFLVNMLGWQQMNGLATDVSASTAHYMDATNVSVTICNVDTLGG